MGDDDRAAGPLAQCVFQPENAVEVQVIGRLVKQQEIGLACDCAGQRDALAHAARKLADQRVGRQAQLVDQRPGARCAGPVFVIRILLAQHGLHDR